jgi:hypothetical protein
MVAGNGWITSELITARFADGQAMGQQVQTRQSKAWQFQAWRSGVGEKQWLSLLVDTMEEVSRPESRAMPCDPSILTALRAQLARPAYAHFASHFSLRN